MYLMKTNLTYHIWTVGCQMNVADSERLASTLEQMGLSSQPELEKADVIVLNSCVVRQGAEDKVVGHVGALKPLKKEFPGKVTALMGCMVGPKSNVLQERFPHIDVFMRPQQFQPLISHLETKLGLDGGCVGALVPPHPSVGANVPVIQGCDLFCTFCIIPYRRGRQKSRPLSEVVHECMALAERGVKEVTLLGQTVDAYGHDLSDGYDLADLMNAVSEVDGIERIRFLTSHPNFLSDRIIKTIADNPKVCEHINLPIQAADDAVLTAMRRGYTSADYMRLIERIRAGIPGVNLSTDVIVGFPGESAGQFQHTYELLESVRFDKIHLAMYSERPGTIASRKLPDDVPQEEKHRRLHILETLERQLSGELNAAMVGSTQEVLFEELDSAQIQTSLPMASVPTGVVRKGTTEEQRVQLRGRTRGNKLVTIDVSDWPDCAPPESLVGKLANVRIEGAGAWSLKGSLVPQ